MLKFWKNGNCGLDNFVTYWPSTELSIKRCTCVNKQKNSETGVSGWRYRNITLTCGHGWIRWWWQMRTPTGSRWAWQLYNQVPQTAWVSSSWSKDASGVRTSSRQKAWALSDPRLSSPARIRKKCCYSQKNFGSICSSLSPSPTHLSHTRNITLSRIKCERYIFIKKCVCSFIEVRHYVWLCSDYIYNCICIMSIQQFWVWFGFIAFQLLYVI